MNPSSDLRLSERSLVDAARSKMMAVESRALQLIVAGVCIPYGFVLFSSLLVLGFWKLSLIIPLVPTAAVFVAGVLALRRHHRWPSVALGGSLYMLTLVLLGSRGSPRTWYQSACTAAGLGLFVFPLVLAAVSIYVLWGRWGQASAVSRADHVG